MAAERISSNALEIGRAPKLRGSLRAFSRHSGLSGHAFRFRVLRTILQTRSIDGRASPAHSTVARGARKQYSKINLHSKREIGVKFWQQSELTQQCRHIP